MEFAGKAGQENVDNRRRQVILSPHMKSFDSIAVGQRAPAEGRRLLLRRAAVGGEVRT